MTKRVSLLALGVIAFTVPLGAGWGALSTGKADELGFAPERMGRIRENAALPAVRIVMLSARGRDVEIGKGLALGADAYVTKPFSTRELVAKVRELLPQPA